MSLSNVEMTQYIGVKVIPFLSGHICHHKVVSFISGISVSTALFSLADNKKGRYMAYSEFLSVLMRGKYELQQTTDTVERPGQPVAGSHLETLWVRVRAGAQRAMVCAAYRPP